MAKAYLACVLGQKACREGFNVIYRRTPRLFSEIEQAKGEGRHLKFLAALAKSDLLLIDDWSLAPLGDGRAFLIATPEKALADVLVADRRGPILSRRKMEASLRESWRIEESRLKDLAGASWMNWRSAIAPGRCDCSPRSWSA